MAVVGITGINARGTYDVVTAYYIFGYLHKFVDPDAFRARRIYAVPHHL